MDLELHDALALLIVDGQQGSDVDGLAVILRAEILRWTTSWTRCRATLQELYDTVCNEILGWDLLPKEAVLIIIQRLSAPSSWSFLVDCLMSTTWTPWRTWRRTVAKKCCSALATGPPSFPDRAGSTRLSCTRLVADVGRGTCNFTWSRCRGW